MAISASATLLPKGLRYNTSVPALLAVGISSTSSELVSILNAESRRLTLSCSHGTLSFGILGVVFLAVSFFSGLEVLGVLFLSILGVYALTVIDRLAGSGIS